MLPFQTLLPDRVMEWPSAPGRRCGLGTWDIILQDTACTPNQRPFYGAKSPVDRISGCGDEVEVGVSLFTITPRDLFGESVLPLSAALGAVGSRNPGFQRGPVSTRGYRKGRIKL